MVGSACEISREGRGECKTEVNKLLLLLRLFWGWVTHFLRLLFLEVGFDLLDIPFSI